MIYERHSMTDGWLKGIYHCQPCVNEGHCPRNSDYGCKRFHERHNERRVVTTDRYA